MDERLLQRFIRLVAVKNGLRVHGQDTETLKKAIFARMKFQGISSPLEYYQFLDSGADESLLERRQLITSLTVGESYFFRDKGQFDLLKNMILPELAKRREKERRLRIWSAGCSTGEEPYSLAITIDGLIERRDGWDILIMGTDINEKFLDKAKAGRYGAWSFRSAQPDILRKYFHKRGDELELDERIRKMVTFLPNDLLNDEFPRYGDGLCDMDLILCRNVFIYYMPEAVSAITEKLARTLSEGGFLMTGHGELYSVASALLRPRIFPESLIYQRVKELPDDVPRSAHEVPDASKVGFLSGLVPESFSPLSGVAATAHHLTEQAVEKDSLPSRLSEAEALFRRGEYRETVEKVKLLLAGNTGDFHALYLISSAYANLGEYERSIVYLRKAIKVNSLAVGAYYLLAYTLEASGKTQEAKEMFKKVLYLDPLCVSACLELASLYDNEGDIERARKLRKSALESLEALPDDKIIEPYGDITAGELILHVRKMLD